MKTAIAVVITVVAWQTAFTQHVKASSETDHPFDGIWSVTLICQEHTDTNSKSLGYTYHFAAEVKNGVLHGEHGTKGAPAWLEIDGKIGPDGSANLHANGLTNRPAYALRNVRTGTPYSYAIKAHFEGAHGNGRRVGGRICSYQFAKE